MEDIVEYKHEAEKKVSDTIIDRINQIRDYGILDPEIYKFLGLSHSTFYRRLKSGKWSDEELLNIQNMWVSRDKNGILKLNNV